MNVFIACSILFLSEPPAVRIELAASGCCLISPERLRRRWGVDCFCDSYVPFLLFRLASDLAEQGGSAAPGWRTRNSPGSELSQGHVQRGIAQWQDLVSDPSRKNPQSGTARWTESPLQVCHTLVGDLEPETYSAGICVAVLPVSFSRSILLGAVERHIKGDPLVGKVCDARS